MAEQHAAEELADREVDLVEVARVLWRGWARIAASILVAVVLSVVIALSLPDEYRAEVLLSPVDDPGSVGGAVAATSALAGLAGLSLGLDQGVDRTELALEVLTSLRFFSEFAEQQDLLAPLLAADGWDPETRTLSYDETVFDPVTGTWTGPDGAPTLQDAHRAFVDRLDYSRIGGSGFVRLSFEHASPDLAAQWLTALIAQLNEEIRRKDIQEAEESIAFLTREVERTTVSDLRVALFELIQSQTETMMLARVRREYVLETLDPAVPPERRSSPQRTLIVLVGGTAGVLFGVAWVLLANAFRRSRD